MAKTLRYQPVLLDLAKSDWRDLGRSLTKITELDAHSLEVQRVGIWLFNPERSAIVCEELYLLQEDQHLRGTVLYAKDYPRYFQALEESRILPAEDAVNDPRTSEFAEGYLKPQGISSMMDVPVRLEGKVVGILCHEHVGEKREWSPEDQEFATSVADMVSLAYTAAARHRAEAALHEKTQELERSNQELESFAYVASHDLQEPLHSIIAFVDRLNGMKTAELEEKGGDLLLRMQRSALRMQRLIDDLLEYSRIGLRKGPMERIELKPFLAELAADLEYRLNESGGRLEVAAAPDVSADPFQVRRLFQNLIANSLKFRRPGVAPLVKVSGRVLEGRFCEIEVEDNGIGFEEKYAEQIFKPFTRLNPHSAFEGSGIGLAVCRKIVERHGGTITARSVPGKGSRFCFTLPSAGKASTAS
ncbi:MAG TPA: ATP-binding protein [bacterium]|nr:ATP-binding protein [bacterium]